MHMAAVYGSLDVMDLLLRLGASAAVLDEFGHTPYDWAVDSGQTGAQKLLLPYTSIASLTSGLEPGVF